MGVLGHARSFEAARSVVAHIMDAVPSGSCLAVNDSKATVAVPYVPQPVEQIRGYFDGLELVDPGVLSITRWRPDPTDVGNVVPLEETTGGVGRKP